MNKHWLIEYAARSAPPGISERLQEEWLADLYERRGSISRLSFGLGCLWAAMIIKHDGCTGTVLSTPAVVEVPIMWAAGCGGHGRSLYSPIEIAADDPTICNLNTTPLIDVLLVLLITLILSLPILTHAVTMNLPHGPINQQISQPQVIDLGIDFDGAVVWNGTPVANSRQLEGYFRTEAQKESQAEIHVRPDAHVKYEFVAAILASAQRNGLRKVGFVNTSDFTQ